MNKPHLRRILAPKGRTVIAAIDHTAFFGPMAGLEQPGDVLQAVVEAGAAGVAIGRNVWKHADSAGMPQALVALVALVHRGAHVDAALQEIGQ